MYNFFKKKTGFLAIVGHNTAGAMDESEDQCKLVFFLAAYENPAGELVQGETLVSKTLPLAELRRYINRIKPYDIIRISGKEVVESRHTVIHMEELLETRLQHPPFEPLIAELKRPILYESASFGTLTLDKRYDWFEGRLSWLGTEIQVHMVAKDVEILRLTEACATTVLQDIAGWDARIREFAAEKLLDTYNYFWREKEDPLVTADDFRRRIQLESITFLRNGAFSFWFEADDFFDGHLIEVNGYTEIGILNAVIAG